MKDKSYAGDSLDVKKIYGTWVAGYDAENLEQVMSIVDPAVIFTEPCVPDQTFDNLVAWYKYDFARTGPRPHWEFEIEWMEASVDLAVVVARWSGFTDFGNKKLQAQVRGFRSVDVFRRTKAGWKIVRTFNEPNECSPAPMKGKKKKK
jgi:ketosteroid isomerase-like protein